MRVEHIRKLEENDGTEGGDATNKREVSFTDWRRWTLV